MIFENNWAPHTPAQRAKLGTPPAQTAWWLLQHCPLCKQRSMLVNYECREGKSQCQRWVFSLIESAHFGALRHWAFDAARICMISGLCAANIRLPWVKCKHNTACASYSIHLSTAHFFTCFNHAFNIFQPYFHLQSYVAIVASRSNSAILQVSRRTVSLPSIIIHHYPFPPHYIALCTHSIALICEFSRQTCPKGFFNWTFFNFS